MKQVSIHIPICAISAIIIFILSTVYLDIWSKLPEIGDWALAIAFILLFFGDEIKAKWSSN